jgi:hypothetical protein
VCHFVYFLLTQLFVGTLSYELGRLTMGEVAVLWGHVSGDWDMPGVGSSLSRRPLSLVFRWEFLVTFSFLHCPLGTRAQITDVCCPVSLLDKECRELVDIAFSGFVYSENLSLRPIWLVFWNRSAGC